jgi:hypothetical protein
LPVVRPITIPPDNHRPSLGESPCGSRYGQDPQARRGGATLAALTRRLRSASSSPQDEPRITPNQAGLAIYGDGAVFPPQVADADCPRDPTSRELPRGRFGPVRTATAAAAPKPGRAPALHGKRNWWRASGRRSFQARAVVSRWREASPRSVGWSLTAGRTASPSPPPKEEGRRFGQISKPCSPRSGPVPG